MKSNVSENSLVCFHVLSLGEKKSDMRLARGAQKNLDGKRLCSQEHGGSFSSAAGCIL